MVNVALLSKKEFIGQAETRNVNEFLSRVFTTYKRIPYVMVGSKFIEIMAVASTEITPEETDILAAAYKVLKDGSVNRHLFKINNAKWITSDVLEDVTLDKKALEEAKHLIDKVKWSYKEQCYHVIFKKSIGGHNEWYIER